MNQPLIVAGREEKISNVLVSFLEEISRPWLLCFGSATDIRQSAVIFKWMSRTALVNVVIISGSCSLVACCVGELSGVYTLFAGFPGFPDSQL